MPKFLVRGLVQESNDREIAFSVGGISVAALRGDGGPTVDGEAGDLKFKIYTAPHERFRRDGNDLHTTVTISLRDSLVRFEKSIPHLDGHLVAVCSKGITKPKEARRIREEACPYI